MGWALQLRCRQAITHSRSIIRISRAATWFGCRRPAANKPLPVVINFHGGGGNAKTQKWYSRMDATADRMGFVVIYPNGSGGVGSVSIPGMPAIAAAGQHFTGSTTSVSRSPCWTIWRGARRSITRAIYATGTIQRLDDGLPLAAEASERIAAVAGVAGAMTLADFCAALPMPVLHIHSVDDERARYDGGLGPALPLGRHAGVPRVRERTC